MEFYPIAERTSAVSDGNWSPSDELLSRIRIAYRLSLEANDTAEDSMWKGINSLKSDIHEALLNDNADLVRLLSNPAQTRLYYGVDNLGPDQRQVGKNGLILNCLVRLAEAVGARRLWNVEAPDLSARLQPRPNGVDVECLLSQIETATGLTLTFPNPFPGETGIPSSRGIISYRSLQAIYQAWRLREIAPLTGAVERAGVIEIGAGVGRTALYWHQLGLGQYTIVDLPMSIVGQAIFLAATLGDESISMYGEKDAPIRLLPPHALDQDLLQYAIALNVDSFSEMTEEVARGYIEQLAKKSAVLVSINHEALPTCPHCYLLERQPLLLRFPYWMRKGYVEELAFFQLNGQRVDG